MSSAAGSKYRRQFSGARRIIEDGLCLEPGDVLTIFWDENTQDVQELLQKAAEKTHIKVQPKFVALAEQRKFDPAEGLRTEIGQLIDESRAVLTCLTATPDCTMFRKQLILAAAQNNKRVGHMPGITLEILQLVPTMKIDYREVEQRCDDLAVALTLGEKAVLRSSTGRPGSRKAEHYDLHLELGGFERPAVLSPGRVPLGRWGNLPGGETFIAPIENKADGEFVLNGAFKSTVMPRDEALVLTFSKGQFSGARGPQALREKFEALFGLAVSGGDQFWRTLAELGVGVNQGIRRLTGVSLFDEKCLGTVHIAIGDNSAFGGKSHSVVHEDFVTVKPSLWIDGKAILDRGNMVFRSEEWRENIDTFPIADELKNGDSVIRRGLVRGRPGERRLETEIGVGDGRLCAYTVGDANTTPLLERMYSKIGTGGAMTTVEELTKKFNKNGSSITPERIRRGLSILKRHRIVAVAHE